LIALLSDYQKAIQQTGDSKKAKILRPTGSNEGYNYKLFFVTDLHHGFRNHRLGYEPSGKAATNLRVRKMEPKKKIEAPTLPSLVR
jgi:hypothetical protein